MSASKPGLTAKHLPGQARRVAAFLVRSEPQRPLPVWSFAVDVVIAAVATVVAITEAMTRSSSIPKFPQSATFVPVTIDGSGTHRVIAYAIMVKHHLIGFTPYPLKVSAPLAPPHMLILLGLALTAAPLAVRRRYPIAAAIVIMVAVIMTRDWSVPVVFATAVFAAYSAVVYSRFRQLALLTVLTGAIIITATFPNTLPRVTERYTAVLVVIPTLAVGIGIREWRRRAGDSAERLRRAQAEHEVATRRAIELERARIASELHDVVTHNVSVMVVQAGAARRVLASSPGDAREALFAVEASGRTAMAELRHLLGLLCPAQMEAGPAAGPAAGTAEAGEAAGGAALRPQPGLGQLSALLRRVSTAGLPVELYTEGSPCGLPPGLDLTAYRVVQEALTNVIKHAGQAPTMVRLDYRPAELVIDVADDGLTAGPGDAGGPGVGPGTGSGRGLIGLRERIALYGGDLDAGPRPGGGWRIRARIPFYASRPGGPDDAPAPADLRAALT
jgi:signal transduction histidine kinase